MLFNYTCHYSLGPTAVIPPPPPPPSPQECFVQQPALGEELHSFKSPIPGTKYKAVSRYRDRSYEYMNTFDTPHIGRADGGAPLFRRCRRGDGVDRTSPLRVVPPLPWAEAYSLGRRRHLHRRQRRALSLTMAAGVITAPSFAAAVMVAATTPAPRWPP